MLQKTFSEFRRFLYIITERLCRIHFLISGSIRTRDKTCPKLLATCFRSLCIISPPFSSGACKVSVNPFRYLVSTAKGAPFPILETSVWCELIGSRSTKIWSSPMHFKLSFGGIYAKKTIFVGNHRPNHFYYCPSVHLRVSGLCSVKFHDHITKIVMSFLACTCCYRFLSKGRHNFAQTFILL